MNHAPVETRALSPDGAVLAAASSVHGVTLWDVAAGRSTAMLANHRGEVRQLAFSPDGSVLATAGEDHTVRLWQVCTGQELYLLAHFKAAVLFLCFPSADQLVAASAADETGRGEVQVFDADGPGAGPLPPLRGPR